MLIEESNSDSHRCDMSPHRAPPENPTATFRRGFRSKTRTLSLRYIVSLSFRRMVEMGR